MLNFSDLSNALNVSGITSLLGEYPTGTPAIFDDPLVPQDYIYNDTLGTINYYLDTNFDARLDWAIYTFTVNCRAKKYSVSKNVADAVLTAVNRVHYSGYYLSCFILPPISPIDDTDNYNNIVLITMKKR